MGKPRTSGPAGTVMLDADSAGAPRTPGARETASSLDDVPESEVPVSVVGAILGGKYRALRLIGEGGMGSVYEGEHTELGKRVAIKLVHADVARSGEAVERFRREARASATIESDHIAEVFDVGRDPEFGLFMVMEYLRGQDLGTYLDAHGPFAPDIAAALVFQAAIALDAAHAAGVVHRDLKPANLFLVPRADGSVIVKLLDFGVAKLVTEGSAGLTRMGSAIGTPQYMSPEQAQGHSTVDTRTDVYALGAVLFEALSGKPAYALLPTYEQMIIQLVTKPTPRLLAVAPAVDPAYDELCAAMMRAAIEERTPSMEAVIAEIVRIQPRVPDMRVELPGLDDGQRPRATMSGTSRVALARPRGPASEARVERSRATTEGDEPPRRAKTVSEIGYEAEAEPPPPKRKSAVIVGVGLFALIAGMGGAAVVISSLKSRGESAPAALTAPTVTAPPPSASAPAVPAPPASVSAVVVTVAPPTPAPTVAGGRPQHPPKGGSVDPKKPDAGKPPTGSKPGSAGLSTAF